TLGHCSLSTARLVLKRFCDEVCRLSHATRKQGTIADSHLWQPYRAHTHVTTANNSNNTARQAGSLGLQPGQAKSNTSPYSWTHAASRLKHTTKPHPSPRRS
ncbi:unnamed protein product, partial [Ectocarpus sp. 12 AP-2014]